MTNLKKIPRRIDRVRTPSGRPGVIESNAVLNGICTTLGFTSIDAFVMFLGAAAFGLILASALYRTFVHYWMNRFIEMRRHSIGERLLETYLRQPRTLPPPPAELAERLSPNAGG